MNTFKAFFQMLYEICIVNVEGEITPPDLPKKLSLLVVSMPDILKYCSVYKGLSSRTNMLSASYMNILGA